MDFDQLAAVMNTMHEVNWDRCIVREVSGVAYGWIPRDDGRFDFALIRWGMDGLGFTTSSAAHSKLFSERLFGPEGGIGHKDCERVEDVFGDRVTRKVVLAPATA